MRSLLSNPPRLLGLRRFGFQGAGEEGCDLPVRTHQGLLFQSAALARFAALWLSGWRGCGARCLCEHAKGLFSKAPQMLGLRRFGLQGGEGMVRGRCASLPARGLFSNAPQMLGLRRFGCQGVGGMCEVVARARQTASSPKRRTCLVCGALDFRGPDTVLG